MKGEGLEISPLSLPWMTSIRIINSKPRAKQCDKIKNLPNRVTVWQISLISYYLLLTTLDGFHNLGFQFLAQLGVVLEQALCGITSLGQFRLAVGEPTAALLDDAVFHA